MKKSKTMKYRIKYKPTRPLLVTFVITILKLLDVVDWSWLAITSVLWGPYALMIATSILYAIGIIEFDMQEK